MTTKEAITLFKYYLQSNHKTRTIESYTLLLDRFNAIHSEKALDKISPDEVFHFLELQARCGLRIGELLKIKVSDVSDRTITLREPKSGKDTERACMPENTPPDAPIRPSTLPFSEGAPSSS